MIREHYMLPMDHPIAIENIRRHIEPSRKFDNVFSKEELDDIWKRAFSDAHPNVRMNRNGTVLISGNLTSIYNDFKEQINKCVGLKASASPTVGGNFFMTPQQYGLHNDSIRPHDFNWTVEQVPMNDSRRKYTCWRNFLLPLWIGTHQDTEDGGQFIAFDQRDIGWAKVYNGGNKTPNIASVYEIVTDYTTLQWYDGHGSLISQEKNSTPFDKEIFNQHINTPYERVAGLSVESILDWTPGSPMVFDAVQIHASNSGTNKNTKSWNSKMGLLLTFLIELDDDLMVEWEREQQAMSK